MNPFAYHTPETPEEVLALLHEHGDNAKLMAGGTALVIMMKQRLVVPETLISLHRLRGLTAVQETNGSLQLGALLTHRAAETAPLVRAHLPALQRGRSDARRSAGSVPVQGRGQNGDPRPEVQKCAPTCGAARCARRASHRATPIGD